MSGGHFDYVNDRLCDDIYGWEVTPYYGSRGFNQSSKARRLNPLEDLVISELVFDVFCLLHSYDWYASGDTCKETYLKDVAYFKEKWLNSLSSSYTREIIDDEIDRLRAELYRSLNIAPIEDNNKEGDRNG